MTEEERIAEITKLVAEQAKDDHSRHVKREYIRRSNPQARPNMITIDPYILDQMEVRKEANDDEDGLTTEDLGLEYDKYHGFCRDDI